MGETWLRQWRGDEPPRLHWALVLALGALTGGLFSGAWLILQANWVRRVSGKRVAWLLATCQLVANALVLSAGYRPLGKVGASVSNDAGDIMWALWIGAVYTLRYDLTHAPFDMFLGRLLPLFFGPIYFQYRLQDFDLEHRPTSTGPLGLSRMKRTEADSPWE